MRLVDLEPRWLSDNMFAFRCPHCLKVFLTCKNMEMDFHKQRVFALIAELEPKGPRYGAVLTKEDMAWQFSSRDFATMTVTPSIDASNSGHWHGFIREGLIQTC